MIFEFLIYLFMIINLANAKGPGLAGKEVVYPMVGDVGRWS